MLQGCFKLAPNWFQNRLTSDVDHLGLPWALLVDFLGGDVEGVCKDMPSFHHLAVQSPEGQKLNGFHDKVVGLERRSMQVHDELMKVRWKRLMHTESSCHCAFFWKDDIQRRRQRCIWSPGLFCWFLESLFCVVHDGSRCPGMYCWRSRWQECGPWGTLLRITIFLHLNITNISISRASQTCYMRNL